MAQVQNKFAVLNTDEVVANEISNNFPNGEELGNISTDLEWHCSSQNRREKAKSNLKKAGNKNLKISKIINNKIKCLYFNARSIMNKKAELELYAVEENPDIIGITETWLKADILDSEISLENYTLFRHDREDARGGGVMLYVKNNLKVTHRDDATNNKFAESVWVDIVSAKEKTLVGVCYRSPSSSKENDNYLLSLIEKVAQETVLIMGDFNFGNDINWLTHEAKGHGTLFLETIGSCFLFQHVEHPTRKNNILDLVLTSDENIVDNLQVGEEFGTSDHQVIRFEVVIGAEVTKDNFKCYNYHCVDYNTIRQVAQDLGLCDSVKGDDVNADWGTFKATLLKIREMAIPLSRKRGQQCRWATRKTTKYRRSKNKAWARYKKLNTVEAYEKYRVKLNQSTGENRRAQLNFENKLAKSIKTDNKSFFAYVRDKQRSKVRVGPLKDTAGKVITDDLTSANILNQYFSSVFTKENTETLPEPQSVFDSSINNELLDIDITEAIVLQKLNNIKLNKSAGIDEIHPRLLFELRNEIVKPLTTLFKNSLSRGHVPDEWKSANVTPLFKKGSKADPQNYRPVSLTCITCKIMESIVKDKIVEHLDKFKLIKDSQHGFTKGKSCLTNLLDFMEDVTKWVDEGHPVDVIYLDFAKAFDKVPHKRLIKKLEAHGISGKISKWISTWLSNRKQRVQLNGFMSDWIDAISGVPQGSVLGPILFLIFINDIDNDLNCKISKFADDTKIARKICTDADAKLLNQDLQLLVNWSDRWQMEFNKDKCVVMHIGATNNKHPYIMGNKILNSTNMERDLGVLIESNCKVSEQCIKAVKKANSMLGLINRKIKYKSKDVITRLYKALVRPHLEYCIQAWNPYLQKDIHLLEGVQRRALKLINGFKYISYEQRLDKTGLTTLEERRVRGDLIEVFKIANGLDKLDFDRFFKKSSSNYLRGHSCKLVKGRSRLNVRQNFFTNRVINRWNALPEHVVAAPNVNIFKNRYDAINH